MPLDPQAQRVVDQVAALNLKPVEDSTPDEARESIRIRTAALGPLEDVAAVADHRVPVAGGEITMPTHYLAHDDQGREPYASPLRAASLARLPSALVITAECDPPRDEGEAHAARLRDAGVPVTLTRDTGMFRGFVRMTRRLDKARTALDEIAGSLQKVFAAIP